MGQPKWLLDAICGLLILLTIAIHEHKCLPEIRLAKSVEGRAKSSLSPSNSSVNTSRKSSRLPNASSNRNSQPIPELAREDVGASSSSRQMSVQEGDSRVPLWNIAHMINSIEQIEPMLR